MSWPTCCLLVAHIHIALSCLPPNPPPLGLSVFGSGGHPHFTQTDRQTEQTSPGAWLKRRPLTSEPMGVMAGGKRVRVTGRNAPRAGTQWELDTRQPISISSCLCHQFVMASNYLQMTPEQGPHLVPLWCLLVLRVHCIKEDLKSSISEGPLVDSQTDTVVFGASPPQGPCQDLRMDQPTLPAAPLEVDVDLGFALFFLFLLCVFLLISMVRCAQMVLDPYSAISVTTYQEEQEGE
ncbi:hypothetical protein ACEWY4_020240 [Coilia grayii]|uniref:Uncharacterized protein n=1 Tax=Coilia grayii TaxID=363190 RepID=A0ABD1JC33_9TELE